MAQPSARTVTDQRFAALVAQSGKVPRATVEKIAAEHAQKAARGEKVGTLAQVLCEQGLLDPRAAAQLMDELATGSATRLDRGSSSSGSHRALPPGGELGPYKILGELGRGGMGVVYRALDVRMRREVALKTLSGVADEESLERFLREARSAGRLSHPGIVRVYAAELVAGVRVIALELIDGTSLSRRIKETGPLPFQEAATIVRDVALAVQAAHEGGVVHRDLKPANVLLDKAGKPRLADFGLARDVQATGLTQTGQAMGTPAYMAPEQALAEADKVGPVTDVYGLGAILYEALAGHAPFMGSTGLAILRKVIDQEPSSASDERSARGLAPVPRDLETICVKALEKRPEKRYGSAREMAEDLDRFLKGAPVLARPIGRFERAVRWTRRRPWVPPVAVLACLAAFLPVWISVRNQRQREREENERNAKKREEGRALDADARKTANAAFADFERRARPVKFYTPRLEKQAVENAAREACRLARALEERFRDDADARAFDIRVHLAAARFCYQVGGTENAKLFATEVSLKGTDDPALSSEINRLRAEIAVRDEALTVLLSKAVESDRNGDRRQAIELFTAAIDKDPRWPELWVLRASAEHMLGEKARAIEDLGHAIDLEPAWYAPYMMRARILVETGDFPGAVASAESAVQCAPNTPDVVWEQVRVLMQYARFGKVAADERDGLELRAIEGLKTLLDSTNPEDRQNARKILDEIQQDRARRH